VQAYSGRELGFRPIRFPPKHDRTTEVDPIVARLVKEGVVHYRALIAHARKADPREPLNKFLSACETSLPTSTVKRGQRMTKSVKPTIVGTTVLVLIGSLWFFVALF
jgi:hypothetical protein